MVMYTQELKNSIWKRMILALKESSVRSTDIQDLQSVVKSRIKNALGNTNEKYISNNRPGEPGGRSVQRVYL